VSEVWECWCEVKASTDGALLVETEHGDKEWIPRSLLEPETEVEQKGDSGTLCIPKWKVRELGWE
jgi:hypothetical protein